MSENNNRCFVIMPFSTPSGYEPDHFTKIYEQIIKPSIEKAGLKAERVDENMLSTDIVAKIFKGLTECDMAICDLSSRNPNVLYELGIRQAYNKPVLLIKDEKTEQIFDVGGLTTIPYESHRLYENVTEAINTISTALKEHMENKEGVIDIIRGRLGKDFKESDIPSSKDMEPNQQILSLLSSLTDDIDLIKRKINNGEEDKFKVYWEFADNIRGVSMRQKQDLLEKVIRHIDKLLSEENDFAKVSEYLEMRNKLEIIHKKSTISSDDYDYIKACRYNLEF